MKLFEFDTSVVVIYPNGRENVFNVVEHSFLENIEILKINSSIHVLCKIFDQWWLFGRKKEPIKVRDVVEYIKPGKD
jgi:hypothetical protein